jgi:plastocyanin
MRGARVFFQLAIIFSACAGISACTPGAATNPTGSNAQVNGAIVVHVSLLKYGSVSSPYGTLGGFSPNPLTVTHGSVVQFVNDDNFAHTASSVGTSGFANGPLASSTQNVSGSDLATANWSSGVLQGAAFSQALIASTPGTYYYQCFFHYAQMHGVIIVQ